MQKNESSVGTWVGRMILMSIPIVNIICFIVWMVKGDEDPNRKNWALGQLCAIIIMFIVSFVFGLMGSN